VDRQHADDDNDSGLDSSDDGGSAAATITGDSGNSVYAYSSNKEKKINESQAMNDK